MRENRQEQVKYEFGVSRGGWQMQFQKTRLERAHWSCCVLHHSSSIIPKWHLSVVSRKSRRHIMMNIRSWINSSISWATFCHQASSAQSSFLMTPHRCLPMPQCHHCHTSESKLLDAWPWLQLHQPMDMGWWCHGLLVQSSSRIIACIPENVWERQDY